MGVARNCWAELGARAVCMLLTPKFTLGSRKSARVRLSLRFGLTEARVTDAGTSRAFNRGARFWKVSESSAGVQVPYLRRQIIRLTAQPDGNIPAKAILTRT